MFQYFLYSKINSQPSPTQRSLSLNIAQVFRKSSLIALFIIQWEKSLVELQEILKRKKRENSKL